MNIVSWVGQVNSYGSLSIVMGGFDFEANGETSD